MESSVLNNSLKKKKNLETRIHNSYIFRLQNSKFSFRAGVALIGDGRLMTLFLLGICLCKCGRRSTEYYSSGRQDWLSEKLEVSCVKIYITDLYRVHGGTTDILCLG